MVSTRLNKFVRRYTNLSSALDTLVNRKLVLLSPSKWDDTNDATLMEYYRSAKKADATLALCCTMSTETYHHWRIFTHGMDGICLEFDRECLTGSLSKDAAIGVGAVEYVLVKEIEALRTADLERLPFLKREGFSDEREWRVIVNSDVLGCQTYDASIELSSLTRVILNPWMPTALGNNLRNIIRRIPGCERLRIDSSRLTNSARWKAAGKQIAGL